MRVAVVQCCAGTDAALNLSVIERAVAEAAHSGADLVCLPECAVLMAPAPARLAQAQSLDGPWSARLAALARRHGCWLNLGGFPERTDDPNRSANTSLLYDRGGALVASYRKIHLFDVRLPDVSLEESASTVAGETPVCVDVEGVRVGLSICYDLRFPELYRLLVAAGATLLLVPSAFTVPTGQAHWEVLLRARAIEDQCYVAAAAQTGAHPGTDRRSYGRSLAVDPWGEVLVDLGAPPGVALFEYSAERVATVRGRLPALAHRRINHP